MLKICKIYLIALVAILLITGCGTTKKMQSSQTDIHLNTVEQTDVSVEEKSESSRQENTEKSESSSEVTEREIIHTEYDTDKEKDPETGQHPIKSQTTTKETTRKETQVNENSSAEESLDSSSSFHDNSYSSQEADAKQTSDTQVKRNSKIEWWIIGFVILVVIGVGIYRKLKRRWPFG